MTTVRRTALIDVFPEEVWAVIADFESISTWADFVDHSSLMTEQTEGVEGTILGDGRSWDQIRFNEFPSKAAFMAVLFDPARLEAQKGHREVAIADTYTMIPRPSTNRIAESIES